MALLFLFNLIFVSQSMKTVLRYLIIIIQQNELNATNTFEHVHPVKTYQHALPVFNGELSLSLSLFFLSLSLTEVRLYFTLSSHVECDQRVS